MAFGFTPPRKQHHNLEGRFDANVGDLVVLTPLTEEINGVGYLGKDSVAGFIINIQPKQVIISTESPSNSKRYARNFFRGYRTYRLADLGDCEIIAPQGGID